MSRIALIEPLGDPGIGTYTHELAEAIWAAGVEVDVFSTADPTVISLPRRHRLFPVLGSALIRQRAMLRAGAPAQTPLSLDTWNAAAQVPRWRWQAPRVRNRLQAMRVALGESYLSIELALWLRANGYDTLWTQWPLLGAATPSVWSAARGVGLRVVHTAHNVFPHEVAPGDVERCRRVYQRADTIVVHSRAAREALAAAFPFAAHKTFASRLGLYTTYARRRGSRDSIRASLRLRPDATLALFFGGVRPYKNVDVVVSALARDTSGMFAALIAGCESGYSDPDPTNPLRRTRRLVNEAGVRDRVHLVPGPFTYEQTSELFEAADVVLLPYLESWGSGILSLALSFAKPVIVTRTGGMEEYVADYPAAVVLDTPTPEAVLAALRTTRERCGRREQPLERPAHLEWHNIVRELVPEVLGRRPRAPGKAATPLPAS